MTNPGRTRVFHWRFFGLSCFLGEHLLKTRLAVSVIMPKWSHQGLRVFVGAIQDLRGGLLFVENTTDWDLKELYVPPAVLSRAVLPKSELVPGTLLAFVQDPEVPCRIQWLRQASMQEAAAYQGSRRPLALPPTWSHQSGSRGTGNEGSPSFPSSSIPERHSSFAEQPSDVDDEPDWVIDTHPMVGLNSEPKRTATTEPTLSPIPRPSPLTPVPQPAVTRRSTRQIIDLRVAQAVKLSKIDSSATKSESGAPLSQRAQPPIPAPAAEPTPKIAEPADCHLFRDVAVFTDQTSPGQPLVLVCLADKRSALQTQWSGEPPPPYVLGLRGKYSAHFLRPHQARKAPVAFWEGLQQKLPNTNVLADSNPGRVSASS